MDLTEQQKQAEWDSVLAETAAKTPAEVPQSKVAVETEQNPAPEAAAVGAEAIEPAAKAKTTDELLTEMLGRFDKLEGRQRNVEGHIGGLTRNQNSMRDTLSAAATAAAATKDAPTKSQVTEAIANPEEWDSLKKDFPEWATATEKFLDARLAQSRGSDPQAIEAMVSERIKGETAAVRKEIIESSLDAVFPGWVDDVKSDGFGVWLGGQSAEVKALAESSRVGDAARMLRLYDEAKKTSPTTAILEQRKQKLANAAAAPRGVRPAAIKSPSEMNAQELWDFEAKASERRRSAA
jgi:hypothetical protein